MIDAAGVLSPLNGARGEGAEPRSGFVPGFLCTESILVVHWRRPARAVSNRLNPNRKTRNVRTRRASKNEKSKAGFVLDTNVLLHDQSSSCNTASEEHDIYVPIRRRRNSTETKACQEVT